MPPSNYTIDVRVKPYVRQYLINNCGNPVDLSKLPKYNSLLRKLIQRPLLRFESLPIPANECYVCISISDDLFYRHGWEMTETSMRMFNAEVENDIKFIMRNYIAPYSVVFPIAVCIRNFQERFKLSEDVWGFDAIKKDIDRNTEVKRSTELEAFVKTMDKKLHRLFVENLSTSGTITKKQKNELNEIYR